MFQRLIKSRNVNHILLLVVQIQNQLSDSTDLHLLALEQGIVVQVVQVIGVTNLYLQEVTLPSFLSQLNDVVLKLVWVLYSFEPTSWEWEVSTHHLTIQVICIQVLKVTTLFSTIKPIAYVLVACLHISMNCLSDATWSTSLKHRQHVRVS